jgi:undecaprenyl diphosphate synthase
VTETALSLADLGISYLTLHAWSWENWQRPAEEVWSVLGLAEQYLCETMGLYFRRNIRMRFIGRAWSLPGSLRAEMERAQVMTAGNTGMTLTFALSYGGRGEIVDAVRRIIGGGVRPEQVTEELIRDYLYAPWLPDPDLVIRTGGDQRTSGFMPWQATYAELRFLAGLAWPSLTVETLLSAVGDYQFRARRFGGLADCAMLGARQSCAAPALRRLVPGDAVADAAASPAAPASARSRRDIISGCSDGNVCGRALAGESMRSVPPGGR